MKCLIAIIVSVLGFGPVDSLFNAGALQPCKEGLETLLTQADSDKEKAQVLWRLSRVTLLEGEAIQGKDARRSVFDKGAEYARKGMKLDPSNEKCYLWHCANLGRSLQTRPMMEQASAVPVLLSDLTTILDKLGKTSYSEAWQALAEIYYNHPFKSNDAAIVSYALRRYQRASAHTPVDKEDYRQLQAFAKTL